ncbi:hypothetical protein [Paraburkholderia xenovorans]
MKTTITRVILLSALCGLCACGVSYRNGKQCEAKMLETYPTQEPAITIQRRAVSHNGIRVVVEATYQVPAKPQLNTLLTVKTVPAPAAVECVFDGESMSSFKWISPVKMVPKPATADAQDQRR